MKKLILILMLPASVLNILSAQSTINCMGGGTLLNGSIYEASIGEMSAVQTLSAGGYHLTQGVLQKMEATPLSVENSGIQLEIDIYPNPTVDILNLRLNNAPQADIHFEVVDVTGKKLLQKDTKVRTSNEVFSFDLSAYSIGTYLLHIHANDGLDKYSKISYQITRK